VRRKLSRALLTGAAALLLLDYGRRRFRRAQLFTPDRQPLVSWNPEDYGLTRANTTPLWFDAARGVRLHGWYCRAEKPIASALYCHGNSGNLTTVAHVMPFLLRAGLNVLLFDYRGYGRSGGSPSLRGVMSDALAAAQLHDALRPPHLPSLVYGFSLGGAIAAQLLLRHPFDGIILQSTFTTLPDIARLSFPRLPVRLLSGHVFDTLSLVRSVDVPALIIHGTDDEVCPPAMAQQLHDACGTARKTLLLVAGGLHKDLFQRKDAGKVVDAIHDFAAVIASA
jgi:alpha-beta hydrolase superfamily lysophospholipase